MSEWVCEFFRDSFIPDDIKNPFRFIYISRKDAMYRKIINEKELEEYLLSHGFEIIEMSKLSFLEQVKICAESKIIVGPHGAGLSNIVFCNNATILELFSPSYVNPCFWQLSKNGNNQYHYLLGEDVSGNGPCELRDFKVNMEDVKKTLNTIFSEHGL